MEDVDVGAMLSEAVAAEGTEMVAESAPEQQAQDVQQATQPEPAQEQIQEPQFDPSNLSNQMNQQAEMIQSMAEQMNNMTNRIPEPQAPQPTEEDMLRQQMKKDLGLDEVEQKFKQQQDVLKQQEQMLAKMQEAEMARTREAEFKTMEAEYGNIDRVAIQNKIMEIGKTNPDLADALNSPDGVRMLLNQGVGAVTAKPDSITPSSSGQDVDMSNQVDQLKAGTLEDSAFGELLLNSI